MGHIPPPPPPPKGMRGRADWTPRAIRAESAFPWWLIVVMPLFYWLASR